MQNMQEYITMHGPVNVKFVLRAQFLFLSNGCTIKYSKKVLKPTLKLIFKCLCMFRFKQPSSGGVAFVLR